MLEACNMYVNDREISWHILEYHQAAMSETTELSPGAIEMQSCIYCRTKVSF